MAAHQNRHTANRQELGGPPQPKGKAREDGQTQTRGEGDQQWSTDIASKRDPEQKSKKKRRDQHLKREAGMPDKLLPDLRTSVVCHADLCGT